MKLRAPIIETWWEMKGIMKAACTVQPVLHQALGEREHCNTVPGSEKFKFQWRKQTCGNDDKACVTGAITEIRVLGQILKILGAGIYLL